MPLLQHLLGGQLSPPCAEQLSGNVLCGLADYRTQLLCRQWPFFGERNLRILGPLSHLSAAVSLGFAFHSFFFLLLGGLGRTRPDSLGMLWP